MLIVYEQGKRNDQLVNKKRTYSYRPLMKVWPIIFVFLLLGVVNISAIRVAVKLRNSWVIVLCVNT